MQNSYIFVLRSLKCDHAFSICTWKMNLEQFLANIESLAYYYWSPVPSTTTDIFLAFSTFEAYR